MLASLILPETSIGAELLKNSDLPPYRRFRQHFTSITTWAFYGPDIKADSDPFDDSSGFLLLSGDEDNRIFISDALTGEVYREYDAFVPEEAWFPFRSRAPNDPLITNSRGPITYLVFSPGARLIAYSDGVSALTGSSAPVFHVLDVYTGRHLGYDHCGTLFSLIFRDEPVEGYDILEAIYEHGGNTYRKYYAFSSNATEMPERIEYLSSFEYKDTDKIRDKTKEDEMAFPGFYANYSGTAVTNGENGIEKSIQRTKEAYDETMDSLIRQGYGPGAVVQPCLRPNSVRSEENDDGSLDKSEQSE